MKQITKTICVYLATEEEDIEFREILHKNGFRWISNKSLLDHSNWKQNYEYNKYINIYTDSFVTSGKSNYKAITFQEFKQQYCNMEKKAIELTLEQAQKLYKESNDDVKNLLLTTFSKEELEEYKYPNTWKKCIDKFQTLYYISEVSSVITSMTLPEDKINYDDLRNCVPSEKIAKQVRALEQLLICRDVWRNGWTPNSDGLRGVIYRYDDKIIIDHGYIRGYTLEFPTKEIAQNFFETFKDLIKEAEDLI